MNRWHLIIAAILLACIGQAHASDVHLEAGAGINHYHTYGDGTWYQLGMPHQLRLDGQMWLVGVTGPWVVRESSGIDWHVDYVDLGHASSLCVCTPLDSNYDNQAHQLRPDAVPVPDAIFAGSGRSRGVLFKATAWKRWHGFRIGASAGLAGYYQTFHETVSNWTPSPDMAPRTVELDASRRWHLGGMVGASISRGRYTLDIERFVMPLPRHYDKVPALWDGGFVVAVTIKI